MPTIPDNPVPRGVEMHAVGARHGPVLPLAAGLERGLVSLRSSVAIIEEKRAA